jgi:hypothetical protein
MLKMSVDETITLRVYSGEVPPSPGYGNLSGIVTGFLGRPVGDALVTLNNEEKRTNAAGEYLFLSVPVGNYTLTVEKEPWYEKYQTSVTIVSESETKIDVVLSLKTSVKYGVPLAAIAGGVGSLAYVTWRKKK